MEGTDKPVSSKEVYVSLDIGDSTLRKYCLALEKHGYIFPRTDNDRRVFFEKDVEVLRQFKHLVKVQNFTMENAAIIVAAKHKEKASLEENSENSVPALRDPDKVINTLLEHIERQESFNKELLNRLDEQQKYIEEYLSQRDRNLMESLRKAQEERMLQLAAAQEENKKGFFSRLFKK